MSTKSIKTVFGGGGLSNGSFKTEADAKQLFDVLEAGKVTTIDTAQLYGDFGGSEALLGNCDAGKRFTIDTKSFGGFSEGHSSEEVVVKDGDESMARLKIPKVDVWYIHAPPKDAPISSTLAGINTLYKKGYFTRFGLSNFKAEDVRSIHAICAEKNYPLPTVYQGNYSAVARLQEDLLFPTLRELGISFYAYSPLAGGLLTKTAADLKEGAGRFDSTSSFPLYHTLYAAKASYVEALGDWEAIARKEGCSRAALAYRWVKYNSPLKPEHGDAIIVGASKLSQVEETLKDLEAGPLSEEACQGIEGIWAKIKHEAPLDNYHH